MRRKKKIEWYTTKTTLYQVYRNGLEYAFVSKDNKQVCPFVYCKDFLQDAVQGCLHKIKRKIYGFTYDPDKHYSLYMKQTRLLVTCAKDSQFRRKIVCCLDFINQIERQLKLKSTVATECVSPPPQYAVSGIWLLEGSHRWMISPPMISMYALLLRIGFVHVVGQNYEDTIEKVVNKDVTPYQNKDRRQLIDAIPGIRRILRYGDRKIFHKDMKANYPAKVSVGVMHNHLGIIRFSQKETKSLFPYWHREAVENI